MKQKIKTILLATVMFITMNMNGQNTIGLQLNSPSAFNGYTLFAPVASQTTYLINNCGDEVHSWLSNYKPRFSCYLMENGVLLRMGRIESSNGNSAILEMIDWDGTVIWDYTVPASIGIQHHDMELLPNGNILLLVTDSISQAKNNQAGGTNMAVSSNSEKIIEISPDLLNGGATIVWEWAAWDHLIQDNDPTKDNFGVIAQHPERINVNFLNQNPGNWLHFNAIDYHAGFDQIMVSARNLSEFWIIDHSTTSIEAADSLGGFYNKGGDLLYRWGNPQAYDQGLAADQKIFGQHHTHWMTNSLPDLNKVILFNNQAGNSVGQMYSNVNILSLPADNLGFYATSTSAFAPNNFDYTYQASPATTFYSPLVSGAEKLPNGNILVCEGVPGHFFELDQNDNIVWEYTNPVNDTGPQNQGTTISNNNVFRCIRYSSDYSGLQGKVLTASGPIENGTTSTCEIYATTLEDKKPIAITIYPNPAHASISISGLAGISPQLINIINAEGKIIVSTTETQNIELNNLSGIYFVLIYHTNGHIIKKLIVE